MDAHAYSASIPQTPRDRGARHRPYGDVWTDQFAHFGNFGVNTKSFNLTEHPHRRYNPLTREWILVSPHRTQRPWQGQVDEPTREQRPAHDPQCYLCTGNARAGGARNPDYAGVFVFDNDYAALLPNTPAGKFDKQHLLIAASVRGICRVLVYSPRHDLTMAELEPLAIRSVVDAWAEQYRELGEFPFVNHVQIFENKGKMMGASNPHPHGQIWASEHIPHEPALEQRAQADYRGDSERCLLCDYLKLELKEQSRIVVANDDFVAVVPFWAVWPFELLLLPTRHIAALPSLVERERNALADILKRLTTRYDNLFRTSFPYSMGLHQAPTDGNEHSEWHLHAHFYPPLLRSATIRKFMVGFEMLGEPQRDITAETSAAQLRALSEIHYTLANDQP